MERLIQLLESCGFEDVSHLGDPPSIDQRLWPGAELYQVAIGIPEPHNWWDGWIKPIQLFWHFNQAQEHDKAVVIYYDRIVVIDYTRKLLACTSRNTHGYAHASAIVGSWFGS